MELPKKGFAIIITDIHGNLTDYNKFINIWENFEGKDNHLIITGDFIHGVGRENDQSVKVLESVKSNFENYSNFHALLGNHEWSVISDVAVYKGGENLSHNFEILLKQRFQDKWKVKLEEYINFFKQLPLAVKTDNKVFISHGGPSKLVKNLQDIINLTDEGYSNERLRELLWNRYGDYDKKDIDLFLKNVGCNAMIVGHTPVDGAKLIGKNQLVVSSSFSRGKKAYVELDLEKKIKNAKDIKKMVRYLN
ncbi:MAG: metallophosphoesterase [Methanomicrobiales archaeon]